MDMDITSADALAQNGAPDNAELNNAPMPEAPVEATEAPVEAAEAPVEAAEAPVEAAEAPVEAAEAPVEAAEAPEENDEPADEPVAPRSKAELLASFAADGVSAEKILGDAQADKRTLDVSEFRSVYEDTLYFVDGMTEQYDFYPEILEAFSAGNASVELRKRYMLKAIEEVWVSKIEDTLTAIGDFIRTPTRFIEETEQVLPIELSRNISNRSLRHLAQHTDYISKVEGDEITPSKILNVFRDETMFTYENKFVNTLLNRLFIFVSRRYEAALKEGKDEKNTCLTFTNEFVHGEAKGKVTFSIELSEEPPEGEVLKNYTYTTDLWQRVVKIYHICRTYMNSDFVKNMGQTYIHPPVIRTNAILKNKNLRQCLDLWEFIESYENIGYNMLVQENLESIDAQYVKELYTTTALQYLIFRYNIRNEFEAEKNLASAMTDHVFSPEFKDELDGIDTEEYDKTYTHRVPEPEVQKVYIPVEKKPVSKEDQKFSEAINVAITADAMRKRKDPRKAPPKRSLLRDVQRTISHKFDAAAKRAAKAYVANKDEIDTELKKFGKDLATVALTIVASSLYEDD
jgi:hypothetical protein